MGRPVLTDFARGLADEPVVFVDLETTGGHPAYHRIIEIGLVAARGDELEWQWSSLVNPGCAIPRYIEQFTSITNEMVLDAPTFADLAPRLRDMLGERLFVAHNARFDYGFMRGEFRRLDSPFNARVACTVKLSRRLFPEMPRHNLDAVIEYHGLACAGDRHRALPDADALWQLWRKLHQTHPREEFELALTEITRRPAVPPALPADIVDELPESHGVYRFYGAPGASVAGAGTVDARDDVEALLYVGKANSIRDRVMQHWTSATQDGKEQRLFEQTRRIEWTETAGELGALLLEARTVRESKPVYNRALRGSDCYTWLIGDDGRAPRCLPLDWTSVRAGDLFGLYPSERKARQALEAIAREHRYCLKALGLEPGKGSCFGHQVGRCSGVCVGKEPAALHMARLKLTLADLRLKPWPWDGPVGVREASTSGREHVHVIEDWQHLATIECRRADESDVHAALRSCAPRTSAFDYDVYRILLRWFRANPKPRLVKLDRAAEASDDVPRELTIEYDPDAIDARMPAASPAPPRARRRSRAARHA